MFDDRLVVDNASRKVSPAMLRRSTLLKSGSRFHLLSSATRSQLITMTYTSLPLVGGADRIAIAAFAVPG